MMPEHSLQEPGRRVSFEAGLLYFSFITETDRHSQEGQRSSSLEGGYQVPRRSPRCQSLAKDSAKPPIPPKPSGPRKRARSSSAAVQEPPPLCSRCDPLSSLPLWSCSKITRSKVKRGRPLGESSKALKKRLDSIRIDPETIHGHPPPWYVTACSSVVVLMSGLYRRGASTPKAKTSENGKLEKKKSTASVEKKKFFKNKIAVALFRPLPW